MSRYEWEQGTIIIPSNQWAGFKASVKARYNKSKMADFDKAKLLHTELLSLHKIHKGKNPFAYRGYWENLLSTAWDAVEKPVFDRWGGRDESAICEEQRWIIEESLFRNGNTNLPLKPLKKSYPLANVSTKILSQGEAHVNFDDKTRGTTWQVDENNRAIDRARQTILGKAFFSALNLVDWTRGSGGKILGNNEYNRDDHAYEGGGGNTVNSNYGLRMRNY